MLKVREFMGAIADELAARGTSARDLVALQFEAASFDLRVIVRPEPHRASRPELGEIFAMVSETCKQDGIALSDLARITFFDTEINLECSGVDGAVYTYPLEAVTVHTRDPAVQASCLVSGRVAHNGQEGPRDLWGLQCSHSVGVRAQAPQATSAVRWPFSFQLAPFVA